MSKAIADIIAERRRQINEEGWSSDHDDTLISSQMAFAASCLCHRAGCKDERQKYPPSWWPRGWKWKRTTSRRLLIKAAALIIAEVERLDRVESK